MPLPNLDTSNLVGEAAPPAPQTTATVAATGTAIGNAAALPANGGIVSVTASNGTAGVQLPASGKGKQITILNSVSGNNLKVYPQTNGTINYGSGNSALTVGGQVSCTLYGYSDLAWYSVPTVPS